jgi:hypothetical protein
LVFIALCVWPAAAQDGNAVGSSVRDASSKQPLDIVTVSVVQDSHVQDTTRQGDGAYILKVPISLGRFDILFTKAGYLDWVDLDVPNKQGQQKRPIVYMIRKTQVKQLAQKELGDLADQAQKVIKRARDAPAPVKKVLLNSAKGNLDVIQASIDPDDPKGKLIKAKVGDSLEELLRLLHND